MDSLISIIIPIFNEEKYLDRCLHSVINQTYSNIEIIIIDDCSTDASRYIYQKFIDNEPRARVYRNDENIGLLKSRYKGIDRAKGEYIIFIDGDDWIEPEAVERLNEAILKYEADMVQMRFRRRFGSVTSQYSETFDASICHRRITGEELYKLSSYIGMRSIITPSCWGKIYRSDILREARRVEFDQFWGEDQILNINVMRSARAIAFIDYIGYNYRWGGRTSKYKYDMLSEYKKVHNLKLLMGQDETATKAELVALLRYHIRQLITELGWTKEAIIHFLQQEMNDPIWEKAGLDDSIEQITMQEANEIHRNPIKYITKRLLR